MKAVFRKTNYLLLIVFLVMGLMWLALSGLLIIKKNITGIGDMIACILVAIIICSAGVVPFLYNYKAYLCIDNNRIKGRFGFFKRLDCDIADVTLVFARFDTMHVVLKDRKYYIMGVENAYELSAFIRQSMPFSPQPVTKERIENVKKCSRDQKKNTMLVFCGVGLSFVWIFITMFLTGARDTSDFSSMDWVYFSIMCVLEVPTLIAAFVFAIRAYKTNFPLEKQIYELRRSIMETSPLLSVPGTVKAVLINADAFRITVHTCIENDDRSVCYCVESIDQNYNLTLVYQSEILDSEESLPKSFRYFQNITERLIKQSI